MSKDNANLRLLGSPVNLFYRNKKRDDKKNVRNRPRSALQNSCFTPDNQERYKRPFSADAKERGQSTRNFLKTYSTELLHSFNNSPNHLKVVPPTAELLNNTNLSKNHIVKKDKDICSNASDYGSEDTYISLGTKIKARAQSVPKVKNSNTKNFIKYRNIAKKGRKSMDNAINEEKATDYGLEVKITERPKTDSSATDFYESPTFKTQSFESYFIPMDKDTKKEDSLAGRVSFGSNNIQAEVEKAIDSYSHRLSMTKHQLSLVEEESTQDLESIPSQHLSSLSPENSIEDAAKHVKETGRGDLTGRTTYVVESEDFPKLSQNFINKSRTYSSFYDDFRSADSYKNKMASTMILTDSSSKDSGYPDSGPNDDKPYKRDYSLPNTSLTIKRSHSQSKIQDQPKSLDSIPSSSKDYIRTYPLDKKSQWTEPVNHSRLLYKDFFLKKEGHIALPPNNSPSKIENAPSTSEEVNVKTYEHNENLEYPSYLRHSTTKAYTSKVIEDYKKELEAINNFHELTIKDIKTDAISPTPMNIDRMFEQHSNHLVEIKQESSSNSQESSTSDHIINEKNTLDTKRDISKITTKELIQNYLKVKGGDYRDVPKSLKKFDRKINNIDNATEDNSSNKIWRDTKSNTNKNSGILRNQNQNMFTMRAPLSARLESVQNDKDIDSWMSLSAPSPRILEIEPTESVVEEIRPEQNTKDSPPNAVPKLQNTEETVKPKELNQKSTVLDIYSMLKEIESYGDHPVTVVSNVDLTDTAQVKQEERSSTPKDNFMEIFEFLEKVEQSANDALSVVTTTTPQTIPKLEALLRLPQPELAQRLVTASLQLEERSCCIALLQESLAHHKEQMVNKISNLEKQSLRNIAKVKQECEEAIKRHQNFIDQLINDKKTLNHRIEQLVDERRSLEERYKRSAQALEERYKLELRNQHDKMAAAQQVARQRWVRQKAEKIKELTVKGLEGELREMAERQQKEIADLKMYHAEQAGRIQAKHAAELEELRRSLEEERESALLKERQLHSSRMEKQILELELTYQEQRTRLIAEMRAENEKAAAALALKEKAQREEIEKWKEEQEKLLEEKRLQLEKEREKDRKNLEEQMKQRNEELERKFEQFRKDFEAEQQIILKRKVSEIAAQHKAERDKEIERAIESLEAEAQAGRRELQDAMRRNKEQYELELKELGETEQATLRRYQEAQARVRQTEDKCAELEVMVTQLETRNKILTEKNIQMELRLEEIRGSCEESWRSRIEGAGKELEDLKRTHEEQMHQLYAKVKVAVARKDSAIQALTRESAKYQEKITLLEQKLQQQRKDFFKHK